MSPGLFRLVTVEGVPLPYAPTVYGGRNIYDGELLIRNDYSFEFIYSGNSGNRLLGTVQKSSGTLILSPDSGTTSLSDTTVIGHVFGDSAVLKIATASSYYTNPGQPIQYPTFVLRRVPADAVAIANGVYVLTSINGTPAPFSYASFGLPVVVLYDTIAFHDGVFCNRSRSQQFTGGGGNSSKLPCTYRGNASALTLRSLLDGTEIPLIAPPSTDSFIVVGASLVRRTWAISGIIDERYERVR
ncbi:MAG: hypothetical protein ABJB66_13575 [Gemmatimonadaceae bacterium]